MTEKTEQMTVGLVDTVPALEEKLAAGEDQFWIYHICNYVCIHVDSYHYVAW